MSIVPNPNADFSPAGGVYTELKPFRFWCQKVLPLVYDDSLSYYELLCKVVDYLNKTMEDVDNAVTEVTALHAAYDQLEDYVNNYFSTLDVQQEINNKLDAMAESGELSDLISPFVEERLPGVVEEQIPGVVGEQIGATVAGQIGNTVAQQIGGTVAGQISPVVADWLGDNITPTTPAVDASLSVAGAAADAKVTGDAITDLKNASNEIQDAVVQGLEIEQGSYATDLVNYTYSKTLANNRIRTTKFYLLEAGKTISVDSDYLARFLVFDLNKNLIAVHEWRNEETLSNDRYILMIIKKSDDSNISVMDAENALTTDMYHYFYTYENIPGHMKPFVNVSIGAIIASDTDMSLKDEFRTDRVKTDFVYALRGDSVSTNNTNYLIRIYLYDDSKVFTQVTDWVDHYQFENDCYCKIVLKNINDAQVYVDDFKKYVVSDIVGLGGMSDITLPNKTPIIEGEDTAWSWWMYPQVVPAHSFRNAVVYGYVDGSGYQGVATANLDNGNIEKVPLSFAGVDDHNGMAVFRHPTNYRYYAFGTTHNVDSIVRMFMSDARYSAFKFRAKVDITFPRNVTYAQVFWNNTTSRILLITRCNVNNWYGVYANEESAYTWGTPFPIVTGDRQYYCMFKETSDSNVLRIVMYSNPNLNRTDTRIRMGFLHLDTGNIYDADNTTLLGDITSGVSYKNFSVVIDIPNYDESQASDSENELRNRLLDVMPNTSPSDVYICYARFTSVNDPKYYVYYNGTTYEVCDCGGVFYNPSVYVGGMIFNRKSQDVLYLSRRDSYGLGHDHIDQYRFNGSDYVFDSEIDTDITFTNNSQKPHHMIRPISDNDSKVLIYQQGFSDPESFSEFYYNSRIHII